LRFLKHCTYLFDSKIIAYFTALSMASVYLGKQM